MLEGPDRRLRVKETSALGRERSWILLCVQAAGLKPVSAFRTFCGSALQWELWLLWLSQGSFTVPLFS